jgi:hypothetical protein
MPLWLINLIPLVWRFFKHWGIYILITLVLVGGPYLLYRHGYNVGYKTGYTQAVKDHPSYNVGSGGVVNNYNAEDYKVIGVRLKLLFLNFKAGY